MMTSQTGLAPPVPRFDGRPPRSAAGRRARSPKLPVAVEMFFALATMQLTRTMAKTLERIALGHVADFAKEEKLDAKSKSPPIKKAAEKESPNEAAAKRVGRQMREAARRSIRTGLPLFESRSKVAAGRALKHSRTEFGRLGIAVKKEPELKWLIDGWRKDNVARIQGLGDEQAARIEKILARGFNRKPESMADEIKEILGDANDKRAELIARDQVLTLNAQINRYRHEAAGGESYIWVTQNDDRVRDEHADLDGEEFTWESGGDPEEGHPGEPINCRCVAFPVPPPKGDDEDED